MTAITTKSGFMFEIDEEVMDDIRLFDLIVKHDSGKRMEQISSVSEILVLFMGEEKKEEYYAYLTEKEGRPKVSTLENDVDAIFKELNTPKKK